ncbi:MAG: hypothetical protein MUC42_12540 [Bryobacter sp.]|jgi:hypothetical protein|nr:hypothetical protein [Bryobacter sp.]
MFGIDWSDPQTIWLNLTNLGLGIVVLVCVGVVGYGIFRDLLARRGAATQAQMDGVVDRMLAQGQGSHAFHTPELGWTMADGGEPEKTEDKKPSARRKASK